MATKTTKKTTPAPEEKAEDKTFKMKRTYIGSYGIFQKDRTYILDSKLQKVLKDDIQEC